jgi:hypothetical protein
MGGGDLGEFLEERLLAVQAEHPGLFAMAAHHQSVLFERRKEREICLRSRIPPSELVVTPSG